jgi:hypothetical protein
MQSPSSLSTPVKFTAAENVCVVLAAVLIVTLVPVLVSAVVGALLPDAAVSLPDDAL